MANESDQVIAAVAWQYALAITCTAPALGAYFAYEKKPQEQADTMMTVVALVCVALSGAQFSTRAPFPWRDSAHLVKCD